MSHELRTPLSGILGMLEPLSQDALDPGKRETLQVALDSGT